MECLLPTVEYFHSLQGEGSHVGKSAFFIRLAKCKVGCPWCDTKESWSDKRHPKENVVTLSKSAVKAQKEGAAFIVITGGEPLHHDLNPLCKAIRKESATFTNKSIPIHLETSGVDSLSGNPDWITLSPKRHAPPIIEVLEHCDELKIVIHEEDDIDFAEQMATLVKGCSQKNPFLFLQSGWNSKEGQKLVFEYVKRNPKWTLSMQTHKWLEIR